ncbi:MAG: alginate export family protein [Phycisphaerae bacterium]
MQNKNRYGLYTIALSAGVAALLASSAHAQDSTGSAGGPSARTQPAAAAAEQEKAKPLRGPKYLVLHGAEDFSYLDGPEGSYRKDFLDPIKRIHLTDDLSLSVGGQLRVRLEAETNRAFGVRRRSQDTFFLHRYFLHTDFLYRKSARLFFEAINAQIEDRDLRLLPIHENRFDVYQLFFDVRPLGDKVPFTVRVGRQELLYGKQRLVSPLDWANTRRRFDGVKVFYRSEKFDIDGFYVRPIPIDLTEGLNRKPDEYREEQHFFGVYAKYKGIKNHYFEPYFLGLRDKGDRTNANGRVGDLSVYTLGARVGGKTGPLDYDGELAGQWGKFSHDTIQAWMGAVDLGWTFKHVPFSPRLGAGFDYGSGDDDPTDNVHQTFNQLFPLGHAYLGYLDLVGRQNILATNVNLTFKPHKKVKTRLAWYTFWNDSKRDALYNAGGVPGRRNRFGTSGHDLGNELDLTIKYALDLHSSMLFGWSHFWGNSFIRSTGPSEDADLFYLQYKFSF